MYIYLLHLLYFSLQNVDTGAVIVQELVPIYQNDTEDSLINKIHEMEYIAYPKALRLLATGAAKLSKLNTVEFN